MILHTSLQVPNLEFEQGIPVLEDREVDLDTENRFPWVL